MRPWHFGWQRIVRLSIVMLVVTLTVMMGRGDPSETLELAFSDLETSTGGIPDFRPDWKEVIGAESRVSMYSAFLDHRVKTVTVIVLAPTTGGIFFECSFWTLSNQTSTVTGHLMILPDQHYPPILSGFIDCPVTYFQDNTNEMIKPFYLRMQGDSHNACIKHNVTGIHHKSRESKEDKPDPVVRVALSLEKGKSKNYSASIPVENLFNRRKRGKLNACVKEMHSNYNSATRLVEFIEFQRILGVDHFTFYNKSVGLDVERVLQYYVNEGLADVMPFSAPHTNTTNIDRVTMSSLNDCVFRSVGRYPLVVVTDVDEIIIPRKVDDILQMVQQLGHFTEYCVQNAFFYLFHDDDEEGGENALLTQRKTRRVEKPNEHMDRSKYLCRPEQVQLAGIHFVHNYIDGGRTTYVDEATALSHHYRSDCVLKNTSLCNRVPTVVDRTAHRFKEPLTNAMIRSCQAIFPAMQGCPPHPDNIR